MIFHFRFYVVLISVTLLFSTVVSGELILADNSDVIKSAAQESVKIFNLEIIKRKLLNSSNIISIVQGDTVSMVWQSDEIAELHIHGYDITFKVNPQEPKTVTFLATATGRFAITSHGFSGGHDHGHQALLYLEVYPK